MFTEWQVFTSLTMWQLVSL